MDNDFEGTEQEYLLAAQERRQQLRRISRQRFFADTHGDDNRWVITDRRTGYAVWQAPTATISVETPDPLTMLVLAALQAWELFEEDDDGLTREDLGDALARMGVNFELLQVSNE